MLHFQIDYVSSIGSHAFLPFRVVLQRIIQSFISNKNRPAIYGQLGQERSVLWGTYRWKSLVERI